MRWQTLHIENNPANKRSRRNSSGAAVVESFHLIARCWCLEEWCGVDAVSLRLTLGWLIALKAHMGVQDLLSSEKVVFCVCLGAGAWLSATLGQDTWTQVQNTPHMACAQTLAAKWKCVIPSLNTCVLLMCWTQFWGAFTGDGWTFTLMQKSTWYWLTMMNY